MAAGLSKKQFYNRAYLQAQKIAHELQQAGVTCEHRGMNVVGNGFSVRYHRANASNGETFGYPVVMIQTLTPQVFGWLQYDKGIAEVKRLFGRTA